VGGPSKFFRPLTRKPLTAWTRFAGAGGPHKGIQPANVPWEIQLACSSGESIDVATYVRLHTDIDLDGLYDLLEMQEVHQSWKHAATANVRESAHGV
jgi:hypothetical protein